MSYYVLVRPEKEDFEKNYLQLSSSESLVEDIKEEMLVNIINNEYKSYHSLKIAVKMLINCVVQEKKSKLCKSFHTDEENWAKEGELLFCGSWLRNCDYNNEETETYVTEQLWLKMKCIPNYDYYDEGEKWVMKCNDIIETLDYLIETMEENVIKELIERYGQVNDTISDEND